MCMQATPASEEAYTDRQPQRRHPPRWLWAALLFATLGCTPDGLTSMREPVYQHRVAYVQDLFRQQERLARVAYDLSIRVLDLCKSKTTYTTGAYLFDWDQTAEEWLDAANDAIGINLHTPGIEVLIVIPGSPAERAGLRVGDRILKLGTWPVPKARGAFAQFRHRLNQQLHDGQSPIDLRIIRDGAFRTISIAPVKACDYPILISDSDEANAYTDGERIVILRGMIEFVRDDEELAIVISHELAHVVLHHIDRQQQQALRGALVGMVFDVLIAAGTGIQTRIGQTLFADLAKLAHSKQFEAEADYMGAYLMAKADRDYSRIPGFLNSFKGGRTERLQYSASHPSFGTRAENARRIVDEIERKQRRGEPLVPDLAAFRARASY